MPTSKTRLSTASTHRVPVEQPPGEVVRVEPPVFQERRQEANACAPSSE